MHIVKITVALIAKKKMSRIEIMQFWIVNLNLELSGALLS